ncbi:hypothetical protein SAMN05443245_4626 [Paraburkholderia fungorum]|uniref:RepB plasmid partition domain-containing protein n=1 Tax=Paraburkholderia fungorum TaxID=134537 RepID=A0A1H1I3W9_9BURK|nr:hypothetical protein [Paraburkholderia fungorum]SDR32350.1 hypothetical protein SAMN05443245_4626 [Paraburkholderia fungorum]
MTARTRPVIGDQQSDVSKTSQYCRLPRLERMQDVMRAQCIRTKRTANAMTHVAEENRRLRRLLDDLLRDTGFISLLDEVGIKRIPSMLVSRIVHTTSEGGAVGGRQPVSTFDVPLQEQSESRFAAPDCLPERTTLCLCCMSNFRRRQVLELMRQTRCFTGDFALALLVASPAAELVTQSRSVRRDSDYVASLQRQERKLQKAVSIVGLLGPEYPLMLVERSLHLVLGRQLLSRASVRTWLATRSPEYFTSLMRLSEGPPRASRRPIRVAE